MQQQSENNSLLKLAEDFLLAMKMERPVETAIEKLAGLDRAVLRQELNSDNKKIAFWINLYNAFNLHIMRADPGISENRRTRMGHFLKRQIVVAGKPLSLVDIENGILRRSQTIWGLGYVRKVIVGAFERENRVAQLDPRIHFALNCGAESCPPIRFYRADQIDADLELATKSYLATEVKVEGEAIHVSALFSMYRGDFGGKRKAMEFIRKYRPEIDAKPSKVIFERWDWTQNLNAFAR